MNPFKNDVAVSLVDDAFLFTTSTRPRPLIIPAYVAVAAGTSRILGVGEEARAMIGREPYNIRAVKVLFEGAPVDMELAGGLLRFGLLKLRESLLQVHPRILLAVRSEGPAMDLAKSMALAARAREVYLLDMGMATAIGMQLEVQKPEIRAVLSISEDWFEFSIISLSGIMSRVTGNVGFDTFVEDIQNHVYLTRHFRTDANAIRSRVLKQGVSTTGDLDLRGWEAWRGSSVLGKAISETIAPQDLALGMLPSLYRMVERMKGAIRKLTAEQQYELSKTPIRATGITIGIPGIPQLLAEHLGCAVTPFKAPHHPSIEGAKAALAEIKFLRRVCNSEK